MLINLRNALMSGKRMPTAKDYAQSGLVAMWDGIENAGWGVHDAAATTWQDLVNGITLTSANGYFSATETSMAWTSRDRLRCYNDTIKTAMCSTSQTLEVGITNSNLPVSLNGVNGIISVAYGQIGAQSDGATSFGQSKSYDGFVRYVLTGDGTTGRLYYNGQEVGSSTNIVNSSAKLSNQFIVNGNAISSGTTSTGSVKYIRIYSRALTASEIAANYAIDKARFGLP